MAILQKDHVQLVFQHNQQVLQRFYLRVQKRGGLELVVVLVVGDEIENVLFKEREFRQYLQRKL